MKLHDDIRAAWRASRSVARVLATLAHRSLALVSAVGMLNVFLAALPAVLLWFGRKVVDAFAGGTAPFPSEAQAVAITFAAFYLTGVILQAAARTVLGMVQALLADRFVLRVNTELIRRVGSLEGLYYFEDPAFHDLRLVVQNESPYAPLSLLRYLTDLASVAIGLAALTFVLAELDIWVPIAILVGAIPAAVVELRAHHLRFEGTRETATDERRRQYALGLLTSAESAKEVRLFDLYPPIMRMYDEVAERIWRRRLGIYRKLLAWSGGSSLWATAWTGLPYLWVIAEATHGRLTLGQLAMYTGGILLMSQQVARLAQSIAGHQSVFRTIALLAHWMELPPRLPLPPSERAKHRRLGKGITIELRYVSFIYPGGTRPALCDVSAEVRSGEVVALVGENGSGKTTLVKLICRLYDPSSGAVLIDGIDAREYDMEALRRAVTVVFQDFMGYDFTLATNVVLGDIERQTDLARLRSAARDARLDEVVGMLPQGYETQLGKRFHGGVDLSIGQWQRVALARAAFRQADLLIMDEPTSALDIMTELEVNQRMRELAHGRTTLVISHRFSTVRMADRILVLRKGQLIEEGDHDSLMRRAGHYAEMYTLQAERYGHESSV